MKAITIVPKAAKLKSTIPLIKLLLINVTTAAETTGNRINNIIKVKMLIFY